jgi:hypothetical protein
LSYLPVLVVYTIYYTELGLPVEILDVYLQSYGSLVVVIVVLVIVFCCVYKYTVFVSSMIQCSFVSVEKIVASRNLNSASLRH